VELLVVIGLIAALGAWFAFGLQGGAKVAALQSGQSMVAGFVNAARQQAVASGRDTRVLLNIDPSGTTEPRRYLRHLVRQLSQPDGWRTEDEMFLPTGVAMLPREPGSPSNLLAPGMVWTRADGSALRSSAFRATGEMSLAINSPVSELWASISFTAAGMTGNSGDLVLATTELLAPGHYGAGESPLRFNNSEQVRGLSLSSYGLASLVAGRMGF
jgi:hypothetical protein